MNYGFFTKTKMMLKGDESNVLIVVSNYEKTNEVTNWVMTEEIYQRMKNDVGAWKVKMKSHVEAA